MFKSSGKKVLVGTGNGYGYGYGIVRQLPYEQQMMLTLNEFIYPYIAGNYDKVKNSFTTIYRDITNRLNPYRQFTAVRITLKSLDIMQKGMNLISENNILKAQIETLIENNKLEKSGGQFQPMLVETGFHVDVEIDSVYFAYILRYGPPKDGIFDSWLLSTMYDFIQQETYQENAPDAGKIETELTVPVI